jgi:hypothetical protein
LYEALKKVYGKIDVPIAEGIMHNLKTGSLHAIVFKPATGDLWVSNATFKKKAYDCPFVHFNLKLALQTTFFQ